MSWAVAQTLPDAAQPAAALPGPRLQSPHRPLRQPGLLRRRAPAEPHLIALGKTQHGDTEGAEERGRGSEP